MTKYNNTGKNNVQKGSSLCIYTVRLWCADELTSHISGDKSERWEVKGVGGAQLCAADCDVVVVVVVRGPPPPPTPCPLS